jgi:CBS domain containing-hemolysin-like protein
VIDSDGSIAGIVTESDLLRMLVRKLREAEESEARPDTSR